MAWSTFSTPRSNKSNQLYDTLPDEIIVTMARTGNSSAVDYLFYRFRGLIERKATAYYYQGAEREDILQEGMIGLYKAIRDFKSEEGHHHFSPFAELCVTRQILSAIKSASREKHMILNSSISLESSPNNDSSGDCLTDIIPDYHAISPETTCVRNYENDRKLERAASLLTPLENRVLQGYIAGETYQEIQENLSVSYRTIDNALQRIKKKLSQHEGS